MTPKDNQSKQNDKINVDLAVIANDIVYIKGDVRDIKSKLEAEYVSRQEFDPVKKVVYGMVTLIITGVVTALLALIIRK